MASARKKTKRRASGSVKGLERLLEDAKKDNDVLAVVLFGSRAGGKPTPISDTDVCIVLGKNADGKSHLYDTMGNKELDVSVFSDLPLYIRFEVVKKGKPLFCRNSKALHELFFDTCLEFVRNRHLYDAMKVGV